MSVFSPAEKIATSSPADRAAVTSPTVFASDAGSSLAEARRMARLSRKISGEKNNKWYEITKKVEDTTKKWMLENKRQAIYPNVDLYSASVYYSMGIPMDLNTPIFAISRIAGWSAHVIEEKFAEAAPKPALYRPKAVYVGRYCGPMGCEYLPISSRNADGPSGSTLDK